METYAKFSFNGEEIQLTEQQFKQALADSKLCRCERCLICRVRQFHREQSSQIIGA